MNTFPNRKYEIILADPPWGYANKSSRAAADKHYETQDLDWIMSLPVQEIAAENCALFLWTVSPMLMEGLCTMDAWGFTFKNKAFSWVKLNPKSLTPFLGMGNYTRANTEDCYLGLRGKLIRESAAVRQLVCEEELVISPREAHSKKPDEVRKRIVDLFGDLPRIELFARQKTEGWDSWGNEVD